MVDVVTLGEAMLRLVPPDYQRLEQTDRFSVTIGGSELNVAAGVNRLGLRSTWISKLPDSPLGRMIANKAREQGVDTSHIIWAPEGRAGLYFVEFGSTPRATEVIYDRKNSAASTLRPGEINWAELFQGAKLFHTSGITPALSTDCLEATLEAMNEARRSNCLTSFDLNYRAKLWSTDDAKACFERILHKVDILVTNLPDARGVLGYTGTHEEIVKRLSEDFHIPTVALTMGEMKTVRSGSLTSMVYSGEVLYTGEDMEYEVVDRFGAGDAFAAGLIYGLLNKGPEQGVKIGNAMAAMKMSIPGDINWVTLEEIERFIEKSRDFGVKR